MGQPSLDQEAWVLGADDCGGDPDNCTFASCGTPQSYEIDTIFMVRVLVSNSGNKTSGSVDWSLWFAPNDNDEDLSIAQVTDVSSTIQIANSSSLTDADDVGTAECTGTGTWQNGEHCELSSTVVPSYELTANGTDYYTEFQFAVKFITGATGTHYLFVRYDGGVLHNATAGGVQVTVDPGSITLTVNNLPHPSTTSVAGALSQKHFLTANNLPHPSSTSAATLSQKHYLAANNLSMSHTTDAAQLGKRGDDSCQCIS